MDTKISSSGDQVSIQPILSNTSGQSSSGQSPSGQSLSGQSPSFYSAPFTTSDGKPGIALRFDDKPISRAIWKRFSRVCQENISFGDIDAEQLLALMHRAKIKPLKGMDILQAQSLRRHSVRQYNISNTYRIENAIAKIARDYIAGRSILDISAQMKLSPYIIFRHVMDYLESDAAATSGAIPDTERRFGMRNKINMLSLGKARAEDILNARDAEQYALVREFDFESIAVQLKMAADANRREANFISFLRDDLGIALKTQADLLEEAVKKGIRPITPDALFLSPVQINGRAAHWIDFKSYCGSSIPFLSRSTALQCAKYQDAFGPGFIVYEHGFVEPPTCPSVSARALRDIIDQGTRKAVLV